MSHDEGNTSVEQVSTEVSLMEAQTETQNSPTQEEETPTAVEQEASAPPLKQSVINQLIQIGKEKGDWKLLGEAIQKGKVEILSKEMLGNIQERFKEYERHMGDYKLILGAQRLLVNVLYPAMKNPQLIKQYIHIKDGKVSIDIPLLAKQLLGYELSLNPMSLMKTAPKMVALFKDNAALKELYENSELKTIVDKLHTTKHLAEVDPPAMAMDYLGICYRNNVIPSIAFEALKYLGLLDEDQVKAIIAELNNENKEDDQDKE